MPMRRLCSLLLAAALLLSLTACGEKQSSGDPPASSPAASAPAASSASSSAASSETPAPEPEPIPEPEPYTILDPTVMPEGGVRDGVNYVAYNGVVEHIFFHPVIA